MKTANAILGLVNTCLASLIWVYCPDSFLRFVLMLIGSILLGWVFDQVVCWFIDGEPASLGSWITGMALIAILCVALGGAGTGLINWVFEKHFPLDGVIYWFLVIAYAVMD